MHFINTLLAWISAILAATAFGALWSLVALGYGGRAPWLALLLGVVLVSVLRFNGHPPGWGRSLAAVALAGIGIAHANYLMASGFIAAQMGLGLVDSLRSIGVEMAWAVSWAQANWHDAAAYGLALALAAWLGKRHPADQSPPRGAAKR
jgi:vitamin B12 transport system permease protein